MLDRIFKILFLLAICALFFVWGFVSKWKEVFPYSIIQEANIAFQALLQLSEEDTGLPSGVDFWVESNRSATPLISSYSSDAGTEFILSLGNRLSYKDAIGGSGYGAWIADREGVVKHAWKGFENVWKDLENRKSVSDEWSYYPVGAHVYENGDLLVSFQGQGIFPFAMGMAKFDKDSNLLWKNSEYIHHWFSVDDAGNIYVPGLIEASPKLRLEERNKTLFCDKGHFYYDSILVLDGAGNKIREIDMVEVLLESELAGLISNDHNNQKTLLTCDPTHLNDVQVLSAEQAQYFPAFAPGDLLLSFRALNTIAVMDTATERIKWHQTGFFNQQHSPRFHNESQILLFDNLGGETRLGISRILALDVSSPISRIVYPANSTALSDVDIYSKTAGHIDLSRDGSRALVAWTHAGLISEVDIKSGQLLWQWINNHAVGEQTGRLSVYTAKYVHDANFAMNAGVLSN